MALNVSLASSLLDFEVAQSELGDGAGGQAFTTGLTSLEKDLPDDLWSGGNVVGIGTDSDNAILDSKSLPLEIVATHLINEGQRGMPAGTAGADPRYGREGPQPNTDVFIIAPPDQGTVSIRRVYQILTSRLAQTDASPRTVSRATVAEYSSQGFSLDAKNLLNGVSLLQYLDIAGLSESVSEVFGALSSQGSGSDGRKRAIVLIQGLSSCIGVTQRRSGIVQTAAVVSSILQSVRNVVHGSGGMCLGLVEVEVGWVGGTVDSTAQATLWDTAVSRAVRQDTGVKGFDTAFASNAGRVLRINMNSILSRIVEEGVEYSR